MSPRMPDRAPPMAPPPGISPDSDDAPALPVSTIGSLGDIWTALHRNVDVVLTQRDVHCLRMAAMVMDDDLISQLLLRKMQQAKVVDHAQLPAGTAAIGSAVEFTFGGQRHTVRLAHPSPSTTTGGLCVTSRYGAGLIGLTAGQTILWPADCDGLRELTVHAVSAGEELPQDAAPC
jgi:regulator of nucleoside diphosphate kinase